MAVERAKVELTQTNRSMWDLPSRIFQKRWCIISTTITANQSIQTWHCYAKTSMPASIYSIFLSTRKKSLLNKVPCVPRVPECLSAQVPKCPSVFWLPKCPNAWKVKCLSALSARVPKCPSSNRVPELPKCLECPSSQLPLKCSSALSALSVSSLRVHWECKWLSKSVSQPIIQLVYKADSVS